MSFTPESKLYELDGERRTLREWCRVYKRDPSLVRNRMRLGWTLEDALKTGKGTVSQRQKGGIK